MMIYEIILALTCAMLAFVMALSVLSSIFKNKLKIRKRIDNLSKDQQKWEVNKKNIRNKKLMTDKLSWISGGKFISKLKDELSVAAIPLRAEEFLIIWLLVTIFPGGLLALFGAGILPCIALVVAGASVPPVLVKRAKAKRMALFDKQLSDALTIIGNCLRAGFTFVQAMESISNEMPNPIAKEFGKTLREIKLGLPMETALQDMVERLANKDLELIVSAVLIQRQVGGNLSEILDSIADTIKERLKIKGEIKVMTATGRTSGLIVGLLPVFLLLILMVMNPTYVSVFFKTKVGMLMLSGGVILEIVGFMVIKRVVDIKF